MSDQPLLEVRDLVKRFELRRPLGGKLRREPAPTLTAVDGVSLSLARNRTLGIVGESGSG
jgi:peptide/nickel transport system ATP-binding protein